jgi:GT2 family glycosyltransferase
MTRLPPPLAATPPQAPRAPRRRARWQGRLEGERAGLLYGWAIDTAQPQARVVLELCLDGEAVACVIADVARADLAARFEAALGAGADPCHGFVADLGDTPSWRDGACGVWSARIANTDVALKGRLDIDVDAAAMPAGGAVYSDGALRLHGWCAAAPERRELPGQGAVRAFVGSRLVAETLAGRRPAGAGATHAAAPQGFELDLPLALADGQPHSVRVVDQHGAALVGSPLTVCCFAAGGKTLLDGGHHPLLERLIDAYERHLPRSLGLDGYRQWSALFEAQDAAAAEPPARQQGGAALRVALIVSGGDAAAVARSSASVAAQSWPARDLFAGAPFAQSLAAALASSCDVLACLRGGDTLAPQALALALEGFALAGAELVYTDSECDGRPWFKPAWNPPYALASDFPLELMLVRVALLRALCAGPADLPASAAALSWRALAALWPRGAAAIVHVPRVLYAFHRPLDAAERLERRAAAAEALTGLAPDAELAALAAPPEQAAPVDGADARRVLYRLPPAAREQGVTLVIPTRDRLDLLRRCIDSIERHTDWARLEIMVVDNGSTQAATRRYLAALRRRGVSVLERPGPFNFAALNNDAVAAARGGLVCLLNNDVEALHAGWLDEMVAQLWQPGVGAVGAKLLWPNGMVQHGGVLLGMGNLAGHFGNRLADADWGDHGRNQLVQQLSAVTAACLLMRRADYLALGGMDARAFPVAFNDVDLCLRLRRAGMAVVWTPHARLLHAESASRGREDTPCKQHRAQREIALLRQRWGALLLSDPAYHPSLNLDAHCQAFGGLALPPRPRRPRGGALAPATEADT